MALISSMLRSSEPGALLLLICLIILVTSAGRTAGTGSTTILGIASQEFLPTQVIIIMIMVVAKISHGIYTDTYKITESALKTVTKRYWFQHHFTTVFSCAYDYF